MRQLIYSFKTMGVRATLLCVLVEVTSLFGLKRVGRARKA